MYSVYPAKNVQHQWERIVFSIDAQRICSHLYLMCHICIYKFEFLKNATATSMIQSISLFIFISYYVSTEQSRFAYFGLFLASRKTEFEKNRNECSVTIIMLFDKFFEKSSRKWNNLITQLSCKIYPAMILCFYVEV